MRVIYLHQYFNTPDMAGGTRSFEIGRRLVAAGHRVEMVTAWREPSTTKGWFTTETEGMRVHWMPVAYSNYMSYRARIKAFFKFAVGAARRAAGLEGDLVFASSTPLTIALPAVYTARRKHIPMVFEVRDLWPELPIAMGALKNPILRWAARRLERFSYVNAARVVALSPGMASGVAGTGYPKTRIAVVPNGADLGFLKRDAARGRAFRHGLGIADDKIVVGYAGTLGRINGVGYLVQVAAALAKDSRFVFLLVGDGQEREQVRVLARKHGVLDKNLLMLTESRKSDMPAIFSAVDIATSLFLPILEMESNSANKFFDAMAASCCIAINYGGWQADLLRETGAGFQLSKDPERAAEDLRVIADHPERLKVAGQNARRLAEDRFSMDDLAMQIEAVMTEVVTEASRLPLS